jgi:hypothetical protein
MRILTRRICRYGELREDEARRPSAIRREALTGCAILGRVWSQVEHEAARASEIVKDKRKRLRGTLWMASARPLF